MYLKYKNKDSETKSSMSDVVVCSKHIIGLTNYPGGGTIIHMTGGIVFAVDADIVDVLNDMSGHRFENGKPILPPPRIECSFCSDISLKPKDSGNYIEKNQYDGRFNILADSGDPYMWGIIEDVSFCPYCGRKLKGEQQ